MEERRSSAIIGIIISLLFCPSLYSNAQQPEWLNFSNGQSQPALAEEGDILWVGTIGGLVRLNKITGEKIFYNSAAGLPGTNVTSIVIDNAGNKWIGMHRDGLVKFDGSNWTSFNTGNSPLPSNDIWSLTIDVDRNVWVGTAHGLAKFDGFTWDVFDEDAFEIFNDIIFSLESNPAGGIWVGTWDGLVRLEGQIYEVYDIPISAMPGNRISSMGYDLNGNLWIGINDFNLREGGLIRFDGHSWDIYKPSRFGLPHGMVYALDVDGLGNLWVGTADGLAKFDGSTWMIFNPENSEVPPGGVISILVDDRDIKWIGNREKGIIKYDDHEWTVYNTSTAPLPSFDQISAITFDHKGIAWLGTPYGLFKYNGTTWESFTPSNSPLPEDGIGAILVDEKDSIWIGNEHRLVQFENNQKYVYRDMFSDRITDMVLDHRKILWIGTDGYGLYRFESITGEVIAQYDRTNSEIPSNRITSLALDDDHNLWIGTDRFDKSPGPARGGLAKFDGMNWTVYDSSNSLLQYNQVWDLAFDQNGYLWIAASSGLIKFDGANWEQYGSACTHLLMIDDRNNKWIGGSDGLARFDNTQWTTYTPFNSGLPENWVWSIAEDHNQNIWIGTANCGFAIFREGGVVGTFLPCDEGPYSVEVSMPEVTISHQNFPNPFNNTTTIKFELSEPSHVYVDIFDIRGRKVQNLVEGEKPAGIHFTIFDARGLSSGLYFYRIEAGSFVDVRKMICAK